MAGIINDIIQNCTETLSTTLKVDSDGVTNSAFVRVAVSDQVQVGMTISGTISNPNSYAEGTTGILVKSITKEVASSSFMNVYFGRPTDNSTASYTVGSNVSLTFTNEGPTPSTYTGGTLSIVDNSFVNTGVPGFKRGNFVKKFTSSAGFVFKNAPTISFKDCTNPSNYTVAVVDTKNSAGLLTAREFTVVVKIGKKSSDDTIKFDAKASAGYNPSVDEITNYKAQTSDLPWFGGSRELEVHGDEGAKFKLRIQQTDSTSTTDKIAEATYTIPKGGIYTRIIRFQKITQNRYYTVTLSEAASGSNFTELISPVVFVINQYIAPAVRSFSRASQLTNNNQGTWTVTGNHLSAGATTTNSVSAYSNQTLNFKVTAKNVGKYVRYNSTGAGFSALAASSFLAATNFTNASAGNSHTGIISYASASSSPATAWQSRSGGGSNDTTNAGATNVGLSINKLVKVNGSKNLFMTRDFTTYGSNLFSAPTGTYSSTTNWPIASGSNPWTRNSGDIQPNATSGDVIYGKLTSSALSDGLTFRLSYTISGVNGGNVAGANDTNNYLFFLAGHAKDNGNVLLPTSLGDHEVFFTQGDEVNGDAITGTFVDGHGATNACRQFLAFGHSGTSNTSLKISNFDLKPVEHDRGPMGNALTATTAYPTYGPSSAQGSRNPDTNKVQLTAHINNKRIVKNMEVRGIGLHSGTYVTSVDGDFITLSSPPSSTGIPKGTTLTFYSPTTLINASDLRFKMTQAIDRTLSSEVIVEGDLIIKSVGTYDVDVDLDLGAFIEADNTAPPAA